MKLTKTYKIILVVLLLAWAVTLGIHFEDELTSSFSIAEGNAWVAFFEEGTAQFYPNTWLIAGNQRSIGIPYLFQVTRDIPPFALSFCFSAHTNRPYQTMELSSIEIAYDDGTHKTVTPSEDRRKVDFWFDDRGIERGETPYYRANFNLPGMLENRQPFWLTVHAQYHAGGPVEQYSQRIRVTPGRTTHVYLGWTRLHLTQLR